LVNTSIIFFLFENAASDMEHDGFVTPRKTAKGTAYSNQNQPLSTANQFDPLTDNNDNTPPVVIAVKPPPIYVYDIENKYHFSRTLAATCQKPPIIKHTNDFIKFQPENKADYDKIEAFCITQKLQYATEIAKKDRPFKVVIRKLPVDTLTQDIHQDFIEQEFPVLDVTQMHGRDKTTKAKVPYPLFLVSLKKEKK